LCVPHPSDDPNDDPSDISLLIFLCPNECCFVSAVGGQQRLDCKIGERAPLPTSLPKKLHPVFHGYKTEQKTMDRRCTVWRRSQLEIWYASQSGLDAAALRTVALACTIAMARIRIPIQPMICSPAAYAVRCRRGTARDPPGAFDVNGDLFKMRHYCATESGQINARWRTDKELAAEFYFKSLKRRAQRWLCDVASLRSAREAQLFARGEEIFHLPYFHGHLA
jgi:hypothetical protein